MHCHYQSNSIIVHRSTITIPVMTLLQLAFTNVQYYLYYTRAFVCSTYIKSTVFNISLVALDDAPHNDSCMTSLLDIFYRYQKRFYTIRNGNLVQFIQPTRFDQAELSSCTLPACFCNILWFSNTSMLEMYMQ